ncbi:MAG: hypothetical protein ACP5QN_03205, partial [Minisyncoccia bacterium]
MERKQRIFLIIFFFILFCFLGTGFVFYAQGFRLNFKTFEISKVGAIYVKTSPAKADIFLNGKLINRGFSLFDSGVLINNLFPKKYLLEIKAKDYKDWKRHIAVLPSLVSEVKYVVLVPEKQNLALKSDIKSFLILPNENFLITNSNDEINSDSFILKGNEIKNVSSDFEKVLTYDFKNKNYWLNNLKINTSADLGLIFKKNNLKFDFKNIIFTKENSNEIILWDKNKISAFDLSKNKLNNLATSSLEILNADSLKTWLVWSEFDAKNNISNFYVFQKITNTLNKFSLPFKNLKLMLKNNNLFILQSDGGIYKYNLISGENLKLASDLQDFYLSEDGNMLAALEHNALEIFNFKDKTDYFRFNFPEAKDILKIEWFRDNRHLFLYFKNEVKFMEIEDLNKENIQTVVNQENGLYDLKTNRFYFVDNDVLKYI